MVGGDTLRTFQHLLRHGTLLRDLHLSQIEIWIKHCNYYCNWNWHCNYSMIHQSSVMSVIGPQNAVYTIIRSLPSNTTTQFIVEKDCNHDCSLMNPNITSTSIASLIEYCAFTCFYFTHVESDNVTLSYVSKIEPCPFAKSHTMIAATSQKSTTHW